MLAKRHTYLGILLLLFLLSPVLSQAQCDASYTSVQKACVNDSVEFSFGSSAYTLSYWDFGDGSNDTGMVVLHPFTQAGSFYVRHILEDLGGCKDTVGDTIHILTAPSISFTTDQNCSDSLVHLYGSLIASNLDTVEALWWYTGTGDSLQGDTISYTYPSSGTYSIQVRADGKGCSTLLDTTAFIKQKPDANFSWNRALCKGDTVAFEFEGTSYSPRYSWNFGDVFSGNANLDSVANPKHRFSNSGNYSIRLVITDTLSCRDTLIQSIHINSPAQAAFNFTDACLGLLTTFTNSSSIDAQDTLSSYYWDFGDGDTSSIAAPTHSFPDTGSYQVRLIVSTNSGCIDTTDITTRIFPQPLIALSSDSSCRSNNVTYQLLSSTSDIQSYLWTFGDGFTSSSLSPVHQYSAAGNYFVNLKTTFTNSRYCISKRDSIRVLPLPAVNFTINEDTQCFKGNQVCVSIINQSANTLRRRILFDDGFVDVSNGPTDTFACHSYSDAAGGSYFIAVQMLDSNGCSQSLSQDTAVLIHPEFDTDFTQNTTNGCFVTQVSFINNSNQSPPEVIDFEWDFGDGSTNTTTWSNLSHSYAVNGSFNVKLWAKNDVGCIDSSFGSSSVTNVKYDVDAAIDSIRSTCSSNNRIYAHQTAISGATIQWVWNGGDTSSIFNSSYSYEFPGTYHPYVVISLNGCDSIRYMDTLTISGPYARIGAVSNRYQCQISDTIYASNTSDYFQNSQRGAFWDFGDAFAPSCTTNYLAGINATGNCRYTTDSVSTKHMYDRNQEGCYYIRLIAYDSITGCSDTVTENVSLTPPVAGPDTASGLNGLFTIQSKTCLGPEADKTISISLTQTQPLCGKENYRVMWDSACAVASGNFNAQWKSLETEHNYDYDNAPCDPDGYVTIGLVIQNGDDSLGNICRDTAWYPRILQFNFMDPRIGSSYDSSQYYCKGSSFDFFLLRQDQDSVNRVIWNWGDGSSTDTNTIDTIAHTYTTAGFFQVINSIYTTDGCTGSDTFTLSVGTSSSLSFSSTALCYGDSFQILPSINYLNDGTNYWSNPARIAANKEALFFNLDDGNGYQNLGIQPWIQNDEIKNYSISVAYRDSLSCWDTVNYTDSVRVYGVFAEFSTIQDTFLCPQAVAFSDLSSLYDTAHSYIQSDDSLVSWTWDFGTNLASSSLQNPERYLGSGTYQVKLIAANKTGCKDSATHSLVIVGPQASFSFTSDSIGCEPLRVYFKNESSNATNYVWQFNDSSNAVLSTSSDTVFYFDYELYGNFIPTLTAQGSFNQAGILVTCESIFPDSTAWDSLRLVSVHETPEAGFTFNTDCANKSSSFTNTSITENNSTMRYLWEFGDGDTTSSINPTHFYADTGHYFVILHVFSEFDCEDTVGHEVIIAPQPAAYFTFNEVCLGSTTLFEDSTEAFNDLIYDWQWTFGDGGGSTLKDPFHDYNSDSTYTVTLIVTNIGGCQDTVSRSLRIHSYPNASFNSASACRDDSVQITSTSSSSELPLSYTWDLGDGSSSTTNSFKHKYANAGGIAISMRITTPWGCADSVTNGISIYQEPIAAFGINDTAQCISEQPFIFTDQSTTGTGTYSVAWAYGDGNTSSGSPVSHSYASYGDYTVTMFATSVFGCKDTSIQTVHVYPASAIGFIIDDAFQCEYENAFTFSDTSGIVLGSISRTWLSGDGNTSTDSVYTHSYSDTGSFTVQLIQQSASGCRDTLRKTIFINPSPRASYTSNDSTQCFRGNAFDFTNTSTIASGSISSTWNFGDAGTSSLDNPSHSYGQDSSWNVRLIMVSDSACADTVDHGMITYPMPVADFAPNDTSSCLSGNSFLFYDSTEIVSGSWTTRWEFGDGDTSMLSQGSHSYTQEGVYSVLLISTSNFLCADSISKSVEVYPMPNASIGASDTSLCFRDHVFDFSDSSTLVYGSFTREWNFGDETTDTNQYTTHTFLKDSSFQVALRVVSMHGCSDSAFQSLIVYPQAVAAFSINDSIQCFSDHLFQYGNQSTLNSGNLSYSWDFGDGNTDTSTSPSHTYITHGSYAVQLISTTLFACADTMEKTVRIDPNPAAYIGLDDSLHCFRDHIFSLEDFSVIASGSFTRVWDFGDGLTDTAQSTTHSYAQDGTYTLALRIESEFGCLDSAFRPYTVYPQATAAFSINDSIQCFSNHLFQFGNQSSVNNGSLQYSWDFGDGNSDTASSPSHSYTSYGTYTVQLISNTVFTCSDTLSKPVRVDPNPRAYIGLGDSLLCFREHTFALNDSSTVATGTYTREWDFGDAITDTAKNTLHSYALEGTYTVALRLETEFGCLDSAFRPYTVYPQAKAVFDVNDSIQCFNGHQFTFPNLSTVSSGPLSYNWEFGDTRTDTNQQVSHVYAVYGDYVVRLIATTPHACADTLDKNIRIDPNPLARIWLNDSFQCTNAQQFELRDSSSLAEGSYDRYWDLGDGTTSNLASFIHPYTVLGVRSISLLLISDKNCRDSSEVGIEVFPKPDPAFVINDSAQCENTNDFQFTNQSTISSGTISSTWNFGDGASSSLDHPIRTYSYADTFHVVLLMTSNEGCVDSTARDLITFPKPHATWVINDTAQCVNTNDFQFTAQTLISSGNIQYTFWDLENLLDTGDLDTARTYALTGTYPVYFYVQSELDCWDTLQNTLTVHPKPQALFQVNDSDQCINTQQFVFANQSSISAGTLSYFWEFGDGDTSSQFEPLKTYLVHDSVDVILYAQSALGCYDTTQHELIILPKPDVVYTVNDSDQCVNGNSFIFTNSSLIDYGTLTYFWDFGNGELSNATDTTIVYASHGTYPVELKALSNAGCSDSLEFAMIVYPKPIPGFSVNDEGQCFNTQDFQIMDESSIAYGNIHYTYRFGDLTEDTMASPEHTYPVFGDFTIRQVLISDYFCKDSMERDIRVFPKPTALFTSNDSTQCINTQDFKFSSTSHVALGKLIGEFWDFDNGNTAVGRNTANYYPLSDFYTVELRVQTDSNCWDTLTQVQRVFPKPIAGIAYNDSAQCLSTNLYEVGSLGFDSTGIDLWSWNIDIDSTTADSSFTYHFKSIGQKTFRHRIKSIDGCWDTTSRLAYVKPMPDPKFTGLSSFHCSNEPAFALQPVVPGGIFSGKNIDINQLYEPRILWEDTVKYWVIVNGCADSSTQYTNVYPFPEVELGSDTVLCKNEFMVFDLTYWNSSYTWQKKPSEAVVSAREPGMFRASVTNVCGTAYDSIYISYLDDLCRIYLPNVFTPNGDDYHPLFRPIEYDLEKMDYKIYNRWGQLMYEADIAAPGWDGTFEGIPVKQDVYIIRVRYEYTLHGEKIVGFLNGNITLLR